jgi:hypothetical protein
LGPWRSESSGLVLIVLGGPGGGFVVGGVVAQAAVQDPDETVGQAPQSVIVADVACPETVIKGAGPR